MPDPSMPQPMPGQGRCPPGYRPGGGAPGQGGDPCVPIGPGIPAGTGSQLGWQSAAPGSGPGYPPTAADAFNALIGLAGGYDGGLAYGDQAKGYVDNYGDWLKTMWAR